jgi:hypothetical protein
MAKAEKMNRGVKRDKLTKGAGSEIRLPAGIHSIDGHGNIFASLPEMSRMVPNYFTFEQLESAIGAGTLTALTHGDLTSLQGAMSRK